MYGMTAAAQTTMCRKRVRPRSGTSGAGKANRSATSAHTESLRRKLEAATAQALEDARVGLTVLIGLSFVPTLVMLGSLVLDVVAGTSLNLSTEWFFYAKFLALAAAMLWAVIFLAPARAFSWWFNQPRTSFSLKRVRPVVDAIAVYAALLMGVAVWTMPAPPGPPEFSVPGPEVYQAQRAMLELRLMALHCMSHASPPYCSRPDVLRIQARYYLQWLEEVPGIFEGRRDCV